MKFVPQWPIVRKPPAFGSPLISSIIQNMKFVLDVMVVVEKDDKPRDIVAYFKENDYKPEKSRRYTKAAKGSWECDICMERNESATIECVACVSRTPEAEHSQDQKKKVKPLFSSR